MLIAATSRVTQTVVKAILVVLSRVIVPPLETPAATYPLRDRGVPMRKMCVRTNAPCPHWRRAEVARSALNDAMRVPGAPTHLRPSYGKFSPANGQTIGRVYEIVRAARCCGCGMPYAVSTC